MIKKGDVVIIKNSYEIKDARGVDVKMFDGRIASDVIRESLKGPQLVSKVDRSIERNVVYIGSHPFKEEDLIKIEGRKIDCKCKICGGTLIPDNHFRHCFHYSLLSEVPIVCGGFKTKIKRKFT